jgi:phosphatidylglycerophosphatase A
LKPASGTWATALAILLYWPFERWNRLPRDGGILWAYALTVLILTAVGIWAADYAEKVYQEKDPHRVVIDEIAGFFFAMILIPWEWRWVLAAFLLFRAFDVWKPAPIRGLQRLRAGWGIMIDDVLAGIYTCGALHVARYFVTW